MFLLSPRSGVRGRRRHDLGERDGEHVACPGASARSHSSPAAALISVIREARRPNSPCLLSSLVPSCMERTTLSCRHLVFPGRAPLVVICCSRSDIVTFPLASQPDTAVLLNSRPKESWFSEGCEGCHKALLQFEGSGAGPGLEARTAASSIANALGRCLIGAPRNSQPEHCSSRLSRAATPQSFTADWRMGCAPVQEGGMQRQKNTSSSLFCAYCMHAQARRASEDVV